MNRFQKTVELFGRALFALTYSSFALAVLGFFMFGHIDRAHPEPAQNYGASVMYASMACGGGAVLAILAGFCLRVKSAPLNGGVCFLIALGLLVYSFIYQVFVALTLHPIC